MSEARFAYVWDTLMERPVRVNININGHRPSHNQSGASRWHVNIWINGYAFGGIEWDTEEEAQRDADRAQAALDTWRKEDTH